MRSRRLIAFVSGASALALLPIAAVPLAVGDGETATDRAWTSFATTKVYATDGSLVARLHGEVDREPVTLGEIPKHVRSAAIAIEDRRFWRHNGVDPRGMARAALENLRSGEMGIQGGSTISQQLVKNVYMRGQTRNFLRKGLEAFLAMGLENTNTKTEILEAYLNTVYFGRGVYGVQAAAKSYFHKDASELTLAEGAFLAGLIHMPARYDWANTDDPAAQSVRKDASRVRRDLVLRVMADQRLITRRQALEASRAPLEIQPPADPRWVHPYFIDAVLRELGVLRSSGSTRPDPRFDVLGKTHDERAQAVYARGLRIYTTLDSDAQRKAEEGLRSQLPPDSLTKLSAALVSLDPGTGYIRALIGGRDYYPEGCAGDEELSRPACRHAKVNLALGSVAGGSGRHAGSAFKPLVLAAALEDGVSLRQQVSSSPFSHRYDGGVWNVQNYDGSGGGLMNVVDATVKSVNAAFARLEIEFLGEGKATEGSKKVAAVARRLGMPFPTEKTLRERCGDLYNRNGECTPADNVPAIALGAKEVSPLDMAAAYATFANEGVYATPTTIARIEDATGKVLYRAEPKRHRAISRTTALGVSHVLQEVVERGTGRAAAVGRPVAGKTGTSQQWRDAWFAGYVPQLATAVWVGNPLLVPNGSGGLTLESLTPRNGYPTRIVGGSYPARIWGAYMTEAVEPLPIEEFPAAPEELFKKPKPPKVESGVPGVVGLSRAAARIALNRAGFGVVVQTGCPPSGGRSGMTVYSQTPGPGSAVEKGATITIWASRAICR
ncbi:MAG: penicillin-binding protein [Actinomycetota bacterium]